MAFFPLPIGLSSIFVYDITQGILKTLGQIDSRIKNLDQIRASVITGWLREYDLSKVQCLGKT